MDIEITILMPCLNEEETIERCIKKAQAWIKASGVECEILIADNGSTDRSVFLAKQMGARVITVTDKGYGNALYFGCMAANGKFIIMGDADDSYDFSALTSFLEAYKLGADFVIGNRFKGGLEIGAMPWKNRVLGNPILSWLGRVLFKTGVGDFHCGLRGITKATFLDLELQTTGMEFASEMVIKAVLKQKSISEVPIKLYADGRSRPPHLRPWRDGWRHLKFMLLYSPRWLFFFPGLAVFLACLFLYILTYLDFANYAGIRLSFHSLVFFQAGIIVGLVLIYLSVIMECLAVEKRLLPANRHLSQLYEWFSPDGGLIVGLMVALLGLLGGISAFNDWSELGFSKVLGEELIYRASLATLLGSLGVLLCIFSLLIGFINLATRTKR